MRDIYARSSDRQDFSAWEAAVAVLRTNNLLARLVQVAVISDLWTPVSIRSQEGDLQDLVLHHVGSDRPSRTVHVDRPPAA